MNELTLLSIAVTLFALSIMFAVFLIRILSDRILSFITYYFM